MIRTGLEVLLTERLHVLSGRRVGLVTQPAAVLPDLTFIYDALVQAGVRFGALFGPEHGFNAAAADGLAVTDGHDPRSGLPVYSLYGQIKEPTPAMLQDVDVLVYDMQDVGVRFYTYLSTLYYLLSASGKTGIPLIVLDRPNPLGGVLMEGAVLESGLESFVGIFPMPVRHGMTPGELALMMNAESRLGADLTVVPLQGWQRVMTFDQTGLPWVPTSPAIGHFVTTLVYPGTCFLEGTNLSEGRGTSLPFEQGGAPWLDGYVLAEYLNKLNLPGVRFRPVAFEPTFSKHNGKVCNGVQVHVFDQQALRPVALGLHLVAAAKAQAPECFAFLPSSWEGNPPHFDLLTGSVRIREGLQAGVPVEDLVRAFQPGLDAFAEQRKPYLLYP
ncbi:MAG TPA: DUF1343 domain-containing protein [Anaerolineaceae bacterium]